jgi:carbohydrate kinase (thermoresistant glucokinase family)
VIRAVVVMGVSGCGKSTLGQAIADALHWRFVEGDALHPPANIAKMAAGLPLDDDDRRPFLEAVADAIAANPTHGVVAACSALKRSYRDLIRARAGPVVFVLPRLSQAALAARMQTRTGHFMPASLLESQIAALEPPGDDEAAVRVDGEAILSAQVAQALIGLRVHGQLAAPRAVDMRKGDVHGHIEVLAAPPHEAPRPSAGSWSTGRKS